MWEQLTSLFECSNRYAWCELSYLHRPFRFNDCKTLLHSVVECDSLSTSIIICLVWSNIATEDVMLSLHGCVLFMSVDTVFVVLGVVCRFMSWVCNLGVSLQEGLLETLCELVLHVFDVSEVWLIVCVTCFIVSSIMLPWLVSWSKVDWGETELIDAGVPMRVGR